MKKTLKLLTLLLAFVMMLQMVPLSALSVTAEEARETEQITPTQDTVSLTVNSMEWRDATKAVVLTPLTDGMTIDCNYVLVRLTLNAIPETATVQVDGVDLTTKIVRKQVLVYVELINGAHRFDFTLTSGSETLTHSFYLNVAGNDSAYPELKVEGASAMLLGATNEIVITGKNLESVGELVVDISMTPSIKVTSIDIAKGLVGTYSWYRGDLRLILEVYDASKISGETLATIRFKTPVSMTPETELFWSVDSIVVAPAEGEELGTTDTFLGTVTQPETEIPVTGGYTVEPKDPYAVGNTEQTLVVKDPEGNPVAGVPVYGKDGDEDVLLGVTDENGEVTTDFFDGKGTFEIFAKDENGVSSFVESVFCYEAVGDADGKPYGLLISGAENGKTFSWMSNYAFTAEVPTVLLSASADMADAVIYTGTSFLQYYHTSLAANRVNTVTVTDLAPGVYYYQVGDGTVWSEPMAFTVKESTAGTPVSFAITSNADAVKLALVTGAMANSGVQYDFAVQTENLISDPATYDAWLNAMASYESFGGLDVLHTTARENGGCILNNEAVYSYSVYGNVFVAIVNYTSDEAEMEAALKDMTMDAKANDYDYRVLIVNRSPAATDVEATEELAAELIPTAAERASMDLVVSGDGNGYTRTEPLYNGVPAEINGVTYMICGASDAYNALYVTVTADENGLTVTVNNVLEDGSVEVVDTFSKVHSVCADGAHLFRLGVNTQYLVCDHCNAKTKLGDLVGMIAVNDNLMYYTGKGFLGGWVEYNGKTYYMDTTYFTAVDGVRRIGSYTYVFENHVLVEGAWVNFGEYKKLAWGGKYLTSTWHTQAGKTYYLLENGAAAVGTVEITETNENGETVTETYIFDEDGALIGKA